MLNKNYNQYTPGPAINHSPTFAIHQARFGAHTLTSVMGDFLDNSIEALSTLIYIHFFLTSDQKLAVAIADNGVGIPADRIESIFQLGHNSLNHKEGGALGKFGVGMKYAAMATGNELQVITKVKGEAVHTVGWDIKRMIAAQFTHLDGPVRLANKEEKLLLSDYFPRWNKHSSGTALILSDFNGSRINREGLAKTIETLKSYIGQTYLHSLEQVEIFISDDCFNSARETNWTAIKPVNPFKGAVLDKTISLDYNPIRGQKANAAIEFWVFPADHKDLDVDVKVGVANSGVYAYRNVREVQGAIKSEFSFPWSTELNRLRVAFRYGGEDDEVIRVNPEKNAVQLDPNLRNFVQDLLGPYYSNYSKQFRDEESSLRDKKSEKVGADIEKFINSFIKNNCPNFLADAWQLGKEKGNLKAALEVANAIRSTREGERPIRPIPDPNRIIHRRKRKAKPILLLEEGGVNNKIPSNNIMVEYAALAANVGGQLVSSDKGMTLLVNQSHRDYFNKLNNPAKQHILGVLSDEAAKQETIESLTKEQRPFAETVLELFLQNKYAKIPTVF